MPRSIPLVTIRAPPRDRGPALRRLLCRPDFRRENPALLQDVARLRAAHPRESRPQWDAFLRRRVVPFAERWKAWPSIDPDLSGLPDRPVRHAVRAVGGGAGLCVTTDAELRAATRRVRERIGRRHQDARTMSGDALALVGDERHPSPRDPRSWGGARKGRTVLPPRRLAHVSEARLEAMIRRLVNGAGPSARRSEVVRRLKAPRFRPRGWCD